MIFINAYFDESLPGQEDDSGLPPEFCVEAGFAQQAHLWIDFSVEWGKILALPKAIEYFHSVEANGRRDQFEGFTRPERDQKVIALIDVIKGHSHCPLFLRYWIASTRNCSSSFLGLCQTIPTFSVCII